MPQIYSAAGKRNSVIPLERTMAVSNGLVGHKRVLVVSSIERRPRFEDFR